MALTLQAYQHRFTVPEEGDPCALWQAYFRQLKKTVGTDNARTIWLLTWSKNGSISCTTNAAFNTVLQQNRIDVSSAATRAVADAAQIGSNFLGMGKNLSRLLSIGIPLALAGVLVGILVMIFNTARKADATNLAMLHPSGRAAKLLSR